MPKHAILLVPGLGDNIYLLEWVQVLWKQNNITVVIHTAPWSKKEETLKPKLERLLKHIDLLVSKGYSVSLVGTSAGGSLVINAYFRRKTKIHKVINVCGRVRKGKGKWLPLVIAAKGHPAFYESVVVCEKELSKLTKNDKEKIMTVSPWPFDGIVPLSCIPIKGAANRTIPIPFHLFGIGAALSIFRKPLVEFIKQ